MLEKKHPWKQAFFKVKTADSQYEYLALNKIAYIICT